MTDLYQVVDWQESYENWKSKNIDQCSWFCNPADLNVRWANLMSKGEAGSCAFGVFTSFLKLFARQNKPRFGLFTHDGRPDGQPYSLTELAMLLYQSEAVIRRSIDLLMLPEINWVRRIEDAAEHAALREAFAIALGGARPADRKSPKGATKSPRETNTETEGDDGGSRASPKAPTEVPVRKEGKDRKKGEEALSNGELLQEVEAKRLFSKLSEPAFGEPLRENQWPYQWAQWLDDELPLARRSWDLIEWFYQLPKDHKIFTVTNRRQSMRSLLENVKSEPQKIRAARETIGLPAWLNGSAPQQAEPEPVSAEWHAALKKIYGADVPVPPYKKNLAPSVIERVGKYLQDEKTHSATA